MTAHIMQYPGSVTTIFGSLPSTYRTMNTGAIRRTWKEERVTPEKCVQRGICIHSCPYSLLKSGYAHYQITVGGRRGAAPRVGRELVTVETDEEVVEVVDRIVYWVYRNAWSDRLLADQMDEIGYEKFAEGIRKEFGQKVEAAEA